MSRYLVFEPAGATGPSEAAVFLRDRFSLPAFLFTFLWMFRYGLWLSGLVTIGLLFAANALGSLPGFAWSGTLITFLVGLLIGLEGTSLRAAKLRRKGWRDVAAFEAETTDEAELIYYHDTPPAAFDPEPPRGALAMAGRDRPTPETHARIERRAIGFVDAGPARDTAGEARPDDDGADGEGERPQPLARSWRDAPGSGETQARRLEDELERAVRVEGWAERWDRPGVEIARLSGSRRRPVGRL
ncbi:DUF2628 domain-containing protein [Jiella sonneratiae]|uniref:DUF2628 domain-containing protein n=1 Tax=Jiella sonneratiae TaxID=2816856 RepID=A0ABS3J3Q7_9HYPH|nr:DUF2628 domain-containing protein [Jiella sonneratiae]MBO0903206.1 DUF2628 domain-containing protein [Jiella sonneratiae]